MKLTKKIRERLGDIEAFLESASIEQPVVDEDGSVSGNTDLYTRCETAQDVAEVAQAVDYVRDLLAKKRFGRKGKR